MDWTIDNLPLELVRAILCVASKQDVRYFLIGVKVERDASRDTPEERETKPQFGGGSYKHVTPATYGFTLAATNGRVLLAVDVNVEGSGIENFPENGVIVPRQLLPTSGQSGFVRIAGDAEECSGETSPPVKLQVTAMDRRYRAKKPTVQGVGIDGTFPPWRQLVPPVGLHDGIPHVAFRADTLALVFKAAGLLSRVADVRFTFGEDTQKPVRMDLPQDVYGVTIPLRI